jgi:hypothetical protein
MESNETTKTSFPLRQNVGTRRNQREQHKLCSLFARRRKIDTLLSERECVRERERERGRKGQRERESVDSAQVKPGANHQTSECD